MRDGFVFYVSFAEQINLVPDEAEREKLRKAIIEYGLYGTDPEFGYPLIATFTPIKKAIDRAAARFDRSVENGKKGGRPSKWIEREDAERLYKELGTWNAVAETLGVDEDTLRKARFAWQQSGSGKKTEKPKNPNNNIQNKNYNQNNSYDELNNNAVDGTRLEAVPPPRGYEWAGGIEMFNGKPVRWARKPESNEVKLVRLK